MSSSQDFPNPDWEPSEDEHAAMMEDFRQVVLWRKTRAAKGINVLAMGKTPDEDSAAMRKWWAEEGQALHELEGAKAERA